VLLLAAILLFVPCVWATELPDAPAPQTPVYSQALQRSPIEWHAFSAQSHFVFDPIKTMQHSRLRWARAIGKVWKYGDKYFDPNAPSRAGGVPGNFHAPSRRHK